MRGSSSDASTGAPVDVFEFVDAGRTFVCSTGVQGAGGGEGWWWFHLASDKRGQRYAPFRTSAGDTRAGVQARIVAYYDNLLLQRSLPTVRTSWGGRPRVNALPPSVVGPEASPA